MQEGIAFAENLAPEAVELDADGHAAALRLKKAGPRARRKR